MQLIRDTFFIKADKDLHKTLSIKGHDGKPLILDTDFGKYEHATQIGQVYGIPLEITSQYKNDNPVKQLDIVVVHHFVVQDPNRVADDIYRCDYFHIWAKIQNDKLEPLEDFIFVEPIQEPESAMYSAGGSFKVKNTRDFIKCQGIVFSPSKSVEAYGILPGDKVFFTKDADYEITILGKKLYRMRLRNIIGVERDGTILCLADKIIVKEVKTPEYKGALIVKNEEKRERLGKVVAVGADVTGVSVGDEVSYFYGISGKLEYNGEVLAIIKKDNVNYVVK
jgi:co-chaperonin GroES (HSP10)